MIKRLVQFGLVGALCLLIQILILLFIERFLPSVIANMIGFIASAQLNFILSYRITWGDSPRKTGRAQAASRLKFNLVVLLSVGINTVVFSWISHVLTVLNMTFTNEAIPHIVAAIGATIVSSSCTFLLNHYLVLKPEEEGANHDTTAGNSNVPASVE
ncbi:MAG: GtrA family protein [Candidatus Saccharibacteria bacterium]|nr:GtrA family protein [Candidatus Saccharibacteria bacterium]